MQKLEYITDLFSRAEYWLIFFTEEEARQKLREIKKIKKGGIICREKSYWTLFVIN